MMKNLSLLLITFLLFSCKKETTERAITENQTDTITTTKIENNTQLSSIVLSCGSSCAMRYTPLKITRNRNEIFVNFEVIIFVNEKEEEIYNEAFIFYYNDAAELLTIKRFEQEEDFLTAQSISNQKSFTDFAKELVQSSKYTFKDSSINEKNIQFLKDFYLQSYATNELSTSKMIDERKKYLSTRLINRIDSLNADQNNLVLDYDPFINAQDFDAKSIEKTLQVQNIAPNKYRVSFILFNGGDEHTIVEVEIKNDENGTPKIYRILNNKLLNF